MENRGHTPPAGIKNQRVECPEKRWFFTGCLSFLVLLNLYGGEIIAYINNSELTEDEIYIHKSTLILTNFI